MGDYYCEKCFCGFLELSDYERHVRHQHGADLRPLHCKKDNRQFNSNKTYLPNIGLTHPLESNCNLTAESSKKKSENTIENQSNSKDGYFTNTNSTKKFTSKKSLNRHLVTHPLGRNCSAAVSVIRNSPERIISKHIY